MGTASGMMLLGHEVPDDHEARSRIVIHGVSPAALAGFVAAMDPLGRDYVAACGFKAEPGRAPFDLLTARYAGEAS